MPLFSCSALMDQKTIDDMVKALVEERLKVLEKIPKNYDNLSNGNEEESLPSLNTQQKSSLSIVQRLWLRSLVVTLKLLILISYMFLLQRLLRIINDAKVPAYGRGCRGRRTVKDEDAADKKKAVQAEAALKRKKKLKKQKHVELRKQKHAGEDSECAVTNDEVLAEEKEFAPESDVENQEVHTYP
ncbi:hypothetical protein F2Q69_00040640 [Brassica cretica]|uniref:Uncharacterized protein n=1 Tax=Brassica cretica TaxID=69181 RepID=A0A8S9NDF8_BRACR|nr:hypothetical protein F2Q69_00040640 [Brassica cretica]